MTPQSLMERRAWAKEFEVEGFRFDGIDRDEGRTSMFRSLWNMLIGIRKHLVQ